MTMTDDRQPDRPEAPDKRVFLVAAFPAGLAGDTEPPAPISGMAEHVVAVIGMAGDRQRFEWVGDGQRDSVANPALVTPIRVGLGLPSPWHPDEDGMVTGLVPLAAEQLGDGSVDDDLDHLLAELARSRDPGPARHPEVGIALMTWWQIAAELLEPLNESGFGGVGHACEFETSLMLHLAPDLVDERRIPAERSYTSCLDWAAGDMLRAPRGFLYRSMAAQSGGSGVVGDPSHASAEKGQEIFRIVSDRLAAMVTEFASAPLDQETAVSGATAAE